MDVDAKQNAIFVFQGVSFISRECLLSICCRLLSCSRWHVRFLHHELQIDVFDVVQNGPWPERMFMLLLLYSSIGYLIPILFSL